MIECIKTCHLSHQLEQPFGFSQYYHAVRTQLLETILAKAQGYVEQGFQALEIKVAKNMSFDKLQIRSMRQTRPDIAYCGGPTEALTIRVTASSYGVNVVPDCWDTQLNLACATHFLATTHVKSGRAEVVAPVLETDRMPNPIRDEMFSTAVTLANGLATVPATPGLGVEVDRQAMEGFGVQETETE